MWTVMGDMCLDRISTTKGHTYTYMSACDERVIVQIAINAC